MSEAIRQAIRDRLASGPLYMRSFQPVKAHVVRMIEVGELRRVAPRGLQARNMVELAPLSRLDQFAEYLAQGMAMAQIRARMGLTNGAAQGLMKRIRDGLGPQAV